MTTVSDLIKVLQTLPPETKVKVLAEFQTNYDTQTRFENIDLTRGIGHCNHLWFGKLGADPELHIGKDY